MESNDKKVIDQALEIDGNMMSVLNETRKWSRFLSIIGFISVIFLVLTGMLIFLSMNEPDPITQAMMPFPYFVLGWIYLGSAILTLIPSIYLYNYSKHTKLALFNGSQEDLYKSFNNMKRFFKFQGFVIIIMFLIIGVTVLGFGIYNLMTA